MDPPPLQNIPELPQNLLEPISESVASTTSIQHFGDLSSLGLCHWTPPGLLQYLLEAVYLTTGLPWWATIVTTTILIRLAIFPFTIKSQRLAAKFSLIKPETDPIQAEQKKCMQEKDTAGARKAMEKLKAVHAKYGLSQLKLMMFGMVPMITFISLFMAINSMGRLPVPGFETEGLAWVKNLSVPDPIHFYFIWVFKVGLLPVISALGMLGATEVITIIRIIIIKKYIHSHTYIHEYYFFVIPLLIVFNFYSTIYLKIIVGYFGANFSSCHVSWC